MGASVFKVVGEGNGIIAVSAPVAVGYARRLISVTVHLSAAPVTAGNVTVKVNAAEGGHMDALLESASMVGVTDWVWQPDTDLILLGGDSVDVAYANPDSRDYGVRVTLKAV